MLGARYDRAFVEMVLFTQSTPIRLIPVSCPECSNQDTMKYALVRQIDAAAEGLQAKGFEEMHAFFGVVRVAKRPKLNTAGDC